VSRVDFDQYAGQYDLAAQTNFFDVDSGYFARYKIELAQQLAGPVNSVLDFTAASAAACRTCARSCPKPISSAAILSRKPRHGAPGEPELPFHIDG
jgi:hypothetical protein